MRSKTFKDNDSYFKFYNKMKDKIKVVSVKANEKIKLLYEEKEGD